MTQITVQSFKMNPSGKSGVIKSADGNDYFYKATQHHHLADGMTFDVAVQESEFNGKRNKWIDGKWPPFGGGSSAPRPAQTSSQPTPPRPAPAPAPANGNKDVLIVAQVLLKGFIQTGNLGVTDLPGILDPVVAVSRALVEKCR